MACGGDTASRTPGGEEMPDAMASGGAGEGGEDDDDAPAACEPPNVGGSVVQWLWPDPV